MMSSSHGYEVTCLEHLSSLQADLGDFMDSKGCCFQETGLGFVREPPRRASFHPRRYGVSMSRDWIAVLRERILVKTNPRVISCIPLTSWKHPETENYRRRWPNPPRRGLCREGLKKNIQECLLYFTTIYG